MRSKFFRLIGRLTVGRKLALIYFLDLTAVIFVSGILINEKFIAIDFARKEIVGNQYGTVVRQALLSIARPADQPEGDRTSASRRSLDEKISSAEARFGKNMGTEKLAAEFRQALRREPALAPPDAIAEPDALDPAFSVGRALLTRIGNQSNLILDPDLDSYYTMSLMVLRFPELLEILATTRELARQMPAVPIQQRQNRQTQFLILEGRLDLIVKGIESDYSEAYAASSPLLAKSMGNAQRDLRQSLERFRLATQILAGLAPGAIDSASFATIEKQAIDALGAAWSNAESELDRLLRARIDVEFRRMWTHLGTAALLLIVILNVVIFVANQIAQPIRKLARVADAVRLSGDYTLRARWDSEDEIGRLVGGFNSMLGQLDHQRIAQQELVAQASAAEAQRNLVEAMPIPLIVTAIPHHEVLHANHAAQAWLPAEGKDPWRMGMEHDARARFFQNLSDIGRVDEFEARWTAGSAPAWALVSGTRLEYQGKPAVLAAFTPINRIKQLESRLELWAKVFEASSEGIVIMDATGRMMTVNLAFQRSTSFDYVELVGRVPTFLLSDRNDKQLFDTMRQAASVKGTWQGEVSIRRKAGETYPAWLAVNGIRDAQGEISHFIAISIDISERKANEQRIQYLAYHDVLTGLPNRSLCKERLEQSIRQARRMGTKTALLFVDLDRFKNINDSLGHHVGDGLLCSVASRLKQAVREGDTVSRLGGDEFVIILNNITQGEEIGKVVEHRVIPAIRRAHEVDGAELYISCSVGIAVFPDDGEDIDQLMRNADSAMYEAKHSGRDMARFFTPDLNERVVRHLHLESDLRMAVARNELVLHYQPRIKASDGSIAGLECLVRWRHPTRGMMAPAEFIPIAEESGLIVAVGAWVIREACRQHRAWREQGLGKIPMSVNLSGIQLKDAGLIPMLSEVLADYQPGQGQIEIELTESILMHDVEATITRLNEIKTLGFLLSVDDFGTGYSSLNYLYRFPIDKLKIDRSFVKSIHDAPKNLSVVKAIIGLGHTLGMQVVAEGVEHAEDRCLLQNAGCDELQGFHVARPMPAAQMKEWLAEWQRMLASP